MLETITVQYRQDTDAALMEVIRKWFHTHHNPSWKEVQQVFLYLKQSGIISLEAVNVQHRGLLRLKSHYIIAMYTIPIVFVRLYMYTTVFFDPQILP